jgi:hypothetical protein
MGQDATPGIPGTPVPGAPVSSPAIPGTPVPGAPSSPGGQPQGGWINPPKNPLADSPPDTSSPGPSAPLLVTPAAGGKFSIVPDKLSAEIPKWEQLLDDLKVDYEIGRRMTQIKVPGSDKDVISKPYVDKANMSGSAFLAHNQAMQNFVVDYVKKMKSALAQHVQTEQANTDAMKRQ